jgi:hypothetical protein
VLEILVSYSTDIYLFLKGDSMDTCLVWYAEMQILVISHKDILDFAL